MRRCRTCASVAGSSTGCGRQIGQVLDHVQQVAAIAVGELGEPRPGLGVERQGMAERLLGARDQRLERGVVEPVQHQDLTARQQGAGQRERRVLGGRADQRDRAVLDLGEQAVLLRAVEAVDLVDEQQRALAGPPLARAPPRRPCADRRRRTSPPRAARSGWPSRCASRRASVVLPLPGGPQRMIEPSWPRANIRPSGVSGPSRWSWPTSSSSARGRSRSASGWPARPPGHRPARPARREQIAHQPITTASATAAALDLELPRQAAPSATAPGQPLDAVDRLIRRAARCMIAAPQAKPRRRAAALDLDHHHARA